MIDEAREDEAVRYALGGMSEPEAAAFHAALAGDEELRDYVRALEPAVAGLAMSVPAVSPPPELLGRILAEVNPSPAPRANSLRWLPWAVAACLAIACTALSLNHVRLKKELTKARHKQEKTQHELVQLRERDVLAQVKIATLSAQVDTYQKVVATVLWNAEKQRGLVEFSALPSLDAEHDYQLWVIDPAKPGPISAGLIAADAAGAARVAFQPVQAVQANLQFALSIEPKGGGPAPKGQIVLAGK